MRKLLCRLSALALTAMALAPASAHAALAGLNITGGAAGGPQVPGALATGAKTIRVFVVYQGGTQPDAGTLAAYDDMVNAINAGGAKAVIVVSGQSPPSDINAFADYMGFLAQRWAGKVAAWEVWNEEDSALWWGIEGGDPMAYAALLRAVYPKVHPYGAVFFGPLTGNDYDFLQAVYQVLGGSSAGAFDGVAVHTDTACSLVAPDQYQRTPDGHISRFSFLGFIEVRRVMVSHGDSGKPIWITEIGWGTSTGVCQSGAFAGKKNAGVTEAQQAAYLALAWHCLGLYPYVTNALWFTFQDGGEATNYGLLRTDGSQKPSYAAFKNAVAGVDPDAGQPCGDFDGPQIKILAPAEGDAYVKDLPIKVTASDPQGVRRITIGTEKGVIRHFDVSARRDAARAAAFPTSRTEGIDWQDIHHTLGVGPHQIVVSAVDSTGNTTNAAVDVFKIAPPAPGTARYTTTGVVLFCDKHGKHCVPANGTLRKGMIVDVRHGSITLTVSNGHGGVYTGTFTGGVFKFGQHRGKHLLITDLKLALEKFGVCAKGDTRSALGGSARRRTIRYLAAKAHGKFNVIGRHASGIERGTSWTTTDTCTTTAIHVISGVVVVTDFFRHHHKTTVKPGHTYVAHAGGKKRRRR